MFEKPTIPQPKGLTIRQPGDPIPTRDQPRNLLEAAAIEPDVEKAKAIICAALGLPIDSPLAKVNLSDDYRWSKVASFTRLMELGRWINAECYECMDLVSMPAVDTRGD